MSNSDSKEIEVIAIEIFDRSYKHLKEKTKISMKV